ncbi:murein hydrolase activator EnvC family protein [Pseudoramibacter alactolyticus]|uniref:murein hydrolase activator EnvC family protein n=1 Tax=Pseudoramibacter alactolyticus TaxID=113287 RepID=UPI0028EFA311|nr:peptidoglycan DD-metalloendopeptidase family protein [Pseudoramibacter alactolyticus]
MKRKIKQKSLAVVLTLACTAFVTTPVLAGSQADLAAKKNQALKQKAQAEEHINTTQTTIQGLTRALTALDNKIKTADQEIEKTNALKADYQRQIAAKQAEINQLKIQQQKQQSKLNERLRVMYMYGKESYTTMMFSSKDFAELVGRIKLIKSIAAADQQKLDSLKSMQANLETKKKELQSIQANLEATLQKQAQAKQDLERARTEQKTLLEKNKTLVAQYQAEIWKQNQVIQSADNEMAAIAKAESAAGQTTTEKASSTSSGFKWPVSVKRITSGFGSRKSPGGIGSTNHQGIDIGAGQGAPIYASASGTVIFAGTSGGYGNCVMINHGNGVTTLYGHQSRIAVSKGQRVNQGDVIGYVGSTGHSTGPHLHFGIMVNGDYVNPLRYVQP